MTDTRGLTIGKLATRGGVNTQTIRHYERRGLITELTKMRGVLARFTAACRGKGPTSDCPILDALDASGA